MGAGVCAAELVLVPSDHLFLAAVGHADQDAIVAHHPDNAVRLLLVGHVEHAAFGDMLGQDRHVWRCIAAGVDLASISELAQLALGALQEQRHIGDLDRLDQGSAIVRVFPDLRIGRRDRPIIGCGQNILAAGRADRQNPRR